jgi:hypothetical protein
MSYTQQAIRQRARSDAGVAVTPSTISTEVMYEEFHEARACARARARCWGLLYDGTFGPGQKRVLQQYASGRRHATRKWRLECELCPGHHRLGGRSRFRLPPRHGWSRHNATRFIEQQRAERAHLSATLALEARHNSASARSFASQLAMTGASEDWR